MPMNTAMLLMTGAEFALWSVLAFLFWKKDLHRRFPAMASYLGLRAGSAPVLLGLLYVLAQSWGQQFYYVYFFTFYAVYIASAVTLFFVCLEIFRSMLSSFTGLLRLGTVAFRWTALVSLLISLVTISYQHRGILIIPDVAFAMMRSVSILELCLLAFLCMSMNALRFTLRDTGFGLAIGFGVMAANDLISASLLSRFTSLTAPVQFIYEGIVMMVVAGWVVECTMPQQVRKPLVMPANSTIYRWNEIASALGHGTQIAVQQPANGFFLTDVERVVEKVLTRNLQGSEGKS